MSKDKGKTCGILRKHVFSSKMWVWAQTSGLSKLAKQTYANAVAGTPLDSVVRAPLFVQFRRGSSLHTIKAKRVK